MTEAENLVQDAYLRFHRSVEKEATRSFESLNWGAVTPLALVRGVGRAT